MTNDRCEPRDMTNRDRKWFDDTIKQLSSEQPRGMCLKHYDIVQIHKNRLEEIRTEGRISSEPFEAVRQISTAAYGFITEVPRWNTMAYLRYQAKHKKSCDAGFIR